MKTFEITKEKIKQLINLSEDNKYPLKQWFPDAFETELEVGKWYKLPNYKLLICITNIESNLAYGFDFYGNYNNETTFGFSDIVEATPQEVESALIAEAKKRYAKNVFIHSLYGVSLKRPLGNTFDYFEDTNHFWSNGVNLFDNGIWAEPYKGKQMTKEEIEKELGYKIEIAE